jgi:hypothetical protein
MLLEEQQIEQYRVMRSLGSGKVAFNDAKVWTL